MVEVNGVVDRDAEHHAYAGSSGRAPQDGHKYKNLQNAPTKLTDVVLLHENVSTEGWGLYILALKSSV